MRNKLKKWIPLIIVTLAGYLAGLIVAPQWFNKFVGKVIIESNELLADGQRIYYCDVEGDGDSEEFIYYHLSDNQQPVINQYSNTGKFQNVWYLDGEVIYNFDFITGDYNNDNLKEIYLFAKEKGWLYLYGIKPYQSNEFWFDKVPVCKVSDAEISADIVVHPGEITDMNGDGFGEVLFSVNSRFSFSPRNVFYYDIKNSQLVKSPNIGMQLVGRPIVFDINKDNTPEILVSTLNSTTQGYVTSTTGANYSAAVALNSNLEFMFLPVVYNSRMSVTNTFPFEGEEKNFVVSLSWPLDNNGSPQLMILNDKGKVINKKLLNQQRFVFDSHRKNYNNILLFSRDGCGYRYNDQLEIEDSLICQSIINQVAFINVDKNNTEELLVVKNNYLEIYQNDFSNPVQLSLPGLGAQKVYFSVKHNKAGPNHLSVQNLNYHHLISYYQHPFYWFKYLVFAAAILLAHLLYFLARRFYNIHFVNQKNHEEELMGLQIDFIKNQLDPHFLFNALNSIAFSINKDDRKTAYTNLTVFSKLMRESIAAIDEFTRPLEEEIKYVKNYFILEKFRFKERFNYDFIVSPEVRKSVIVPKMIIFCFAESALKRGVLPKNEEGRIEIVVDVIPREATIIHIKDDGLPRSFQGTNPQLSHNIKILFRLIDYFNSFNFQKITWKCDNHDEKKPQKGCHVQLVMPYDYTYPPLSGL